MPKPQPLSNAVKPNFEAQRQATAMVAKAKADAEKHAADLRVKADADLHMMREQATKEIKAAKEAAISELNARAGSPAT